MSPWHEEEDIPRVAKADATDATAVFIAWERLRLVYNGILAAVVLLLGGGSLVREPRFWSLLIGGAIGANVCFCAGICAEGYLALLGLPRRETRAVLFVAGTLLAILLTGLCIFSFTFARF
jgi:hypothetical protein